MCGLRFLVKIMWNMCGIMMVVVKNISSSVCYGFLVSGVCRVVSVVWFCSS